MQNRELNGPMEGWRHAHTFPFEGLLCHSAQQQEGKCGRGFSHLGDNAGEARWERSSVLQKTKREFSCSWILKGVFLQLDELCLIFILPDTELRQ